MSHVPEFTKAQSADREHLANLLQMRTNALARVVAENEQLRATVARVEALAAAWDAWDGSPEGPGTSPYVRDALHTALHPEETP